MFRVLPDTYVVVNIGSQVVKTKTQRQNSNPVWGQMYDLLLYDERQTLTVSVFGEELTGSSNIGAALELQVADIILSGEEGKWVGLLPHKMTSQGQVLLKATVFDLYAHPEEIEGCIADANQIAINTTSRRSSSAAEPSAAVDNMDGPVYDMKETELADGYDVSGQLVALALANDPQREAGCVLLLTCEILGGSLAHDFVTPNDVLMEVTVGKAGQKQPCSEASEDSQGISDKTHRAIQRLAALSLTADVIADALGENPEQVQRIMRKHGWNLECAQKICVMVHPSDLRTENKVTIKAVTGKGAVVAMGHVTFDNILQTTNARLTLVLTCEDELGSKTLDLDLELRLYALRKQSLQGADLSI
jgi:hypothetical protein